MTPRLSTERLELVPLAPEDAAEMVGVLADASLYAYIGGGPPTLAELEERFPRWAHGSPRSGEDWHNWVVRLRDDGVAIGHLQATVVGDGRQADVAWVIGAPWQGRGYASEAARAIVGWLEEVGVATVTAHIEAGHEASGRVAAAAGLQRTDKIEDGEIVWRRRRILGACPTRRPVAAAAPTRSMPRRPRAISSATSRQVPPPRRGP